MNIRTAEKELTTRQQELESLETSKSKLQAEINALQESRAVAVKELATGNEQAQKTITNYDARIAPISLKLEGTDHLIRTAQEKVDRAKANLAEAKVEREKALKAYLAEKEAAEIERIKASLPARKQRIQDLYAELCLEFGQLQVDSIQFVAGERQDIKEIADFAYDLPRQFNSALQAQGLKPLLSGGHAGNVEVWGHIRPDRATTEGTQNALDIASRRHSRQLARYAQEFESLNAG